MTCGSIHLLVFQSQVSYITLSSIRPPLAYYERANDRKVPVTVADRAVGRARHRFRAVAFVQQWVRIPLKLQYFSLFFLSLLLKLRT